MKTSTLKGTSLTSTPFYGWMATAILAALLLGGALALAMPKLRSS
jgi:hypothetical protein